MVLVTSRKNNCWYMLTLQLNSRNFKLYLFLVLCTVVGSGIQSTYISISWWTTLSIRVTSKMVLIFLQCVPVEVLYIWWYHRLIFFQVIYLFIYKSGCIWHHLLYLCYRGVLLWVLNNCCTIFKARLDFGIPFLLP